VTEDKGAPLRKTTRRERGNGEAWVAGKYTMFVFLRLVIIFSLCWAVVGSWSYGYLIDYLGLGGMSLELKWSLFIGLSLLVVIITATLFIGASQMVLRIYRSFQRNN